MFRTARRVLAIYIAFVLTLVPGRMAESAGTSSAVSRDPSITFVGGNSSTRHGRRRREPLRAVWLSLPDLEVHIHEDRSGCGDMQGMFRPSGDVGLIDLCYAGEFLALHELGHTWEHFNLDPADREHFKQLTGATTWRSTNVVWRRRGAELTANTRAHGLLSTPLESADQHALDFERFETLTGLPSPRLAELEPQADIAPVMSEAERAPVAAYAVQRASQTGPAGSP